MAAILKRGLSSAERSSIPRGNTCPGVNEWIAADLATRFERDASFKLLDAPSGSGEFVAGLKHLFPNIDATECDIAADRGNEIHADLSQMEEGRFARDHDVVTCISGLMEFGNLLAFLKAVRRSITDDGVFYVTNDNLLTVKDRLLFLIGGRYSQYRFDPRPSRTTWKVTPLQNLVRQVLDAGFRISRIVYIKPAASEYFWLPLATALFITQRLLGSRAESLRPFRSMLSRHYVLVCEPN